MTWIIIEINILVFIPLINLKKNKYQSESALKYFIAQAVASVFILLRLFTLFNSNSITSTILIIALILKIGVAPFHQWIPAIAEGLQWEVILILLIPQKIGPLILIYQTLISDFIDKKLFLFIFLTTLVGGVGGLINYSLRKILVYSSISHSGWILASVIVSLKLWLSYFIVYSIILTSIIISFKLIKINNLNQIFLINNKTLKYSLIIIFLSMSGLPPFRGFLIKYMVILSVRLTDYKIILIPLILATLIRLFFYIRVILLNIFESNIKIYKPTVYKYTNKKIIIINFFGLINGWCFFLLLDFKLIKLKDFKSLNKIILKSSKP